MVCCQCRERAVIQLQHGSLCKKHFLRYFEEKVFKTIKHRQLVGRDDKVCVAVSGGKDSQTVLYLIKKYFLKNNIPAKNLFALGIDEGIKGYRENTLRDLKKFCRKEKVDLKIVSCKKEFDYTLDQAVRKIKDKKPCNICGIWRRYLLNKYARKFGATKLVTGHNLDDEAQVTLMNLFKSNRELFSHHGPISGIEEHSGFVQRVKPLYFCLEKEDRLYALLKKFSVSFNECPYARQGYRNKIRDVLNDLENQYHGTKQGLIKSYLSLLPVLKESARKEIRERIRNCSKCSEPANQNVCGACRILEGLER